MFPSDEGRQYLLLDLYSGAGGSLTQYNTNNHSGNRLLEHTGYYNKPMMSPVYINQMKSCWNYMFSYTSIPRNQWGWIASMLNFATYRERMNKLRVTQPELLNRFEIYEYNKKKIESLTEYELASNLITWFRNSNMRWNNLYQFGTAHCKRIDEVMYYELIDYTPNGERYIEEYLTEGGGFKAIRSLIGHIISHWCSSVEVISSSSEHINWYNLLLAYTLMNKTKQQIQELNPDDIQIEWPSLSLTG